MDILVLLSESLWVWTVHWCYQSSQLYTVWYFSANLKLFIHKSSSHGINIPNIQELGMKFTLSHWPLGKSYSRFNVKKSCKIRNDITHILFLSNSFKSFIEKIMHIIYGLGKSQILKDPSKITYLLLFFLNTCLPLNTSYFVLYIIRCSSLNNSYKNLI